MQRMETVNIILCGLGGQGILFMTRLLAQAALDKGYNVMGAETHGMAQRGGSVISHLRLGDVKSSMVRAGAAHYLLALEESEGYRNLAFLAGDAGMFVNTDADIFPRDEVRSFFERKKVNCRAIPAGIIARELGAPRSANLALLGYFTALAEGPVKSEEVRSVIEKISPDAFREMNLEVFDAGCLRAQEENKVENQR